MVVCSFLPAVTQMIYDMGLAHLLEGVTFECPEVALSEKSVVVHCELEGKDYTSKEIDELFTASKSEGKDLYYVDDRVLAEIAPDIIITQDVCEVCQIDTECTAIAVSKLEKEPQVIAISPDNLDDVFTSVSVIAKALGYPHKGEEYIASLQKRIQTVVDRLRSEKAPMKRVSLLEWVDPLFNCGHWIPDQIALAGGVDMLSNPAGDSIRLDWEKLVRYDPEVLIIAPCGYHPDRTKEDMHFLETKAEWQQLKAVKSGAVHLLDFAYFTQPSASTLVRGIELLAEAFHPQVFEIKEN